MEKQTVSIWSDDGRIKSLRFAAGPRQLALLNGTRRESKLCLSKNKGFYLVVSCEVPDDQMLQDPSGILGVDMGIDNIAVDSEGQFYDQGTIKQVRSRYARLRADLQSKGTKSSRRKLRRTANSESRFVGTVNHQISKQIVTKAKDTGQFIGLEDLSRIRQAPANKNHRRNLNSWGFYDLRTKIEYKALRAGILVMVVLPSFTSQRCSSCGFTDKKNRKGPDFCCIDCGHAEHADVNAAKNIAFRANVNRPIVYKSPSGPDKPTTLVVGS
jgi:IS605 OrfB family transposase